MTEESEARQWTIERKFTGIANMHAADDQLPEVLDILRELFEYVKDIDARLQRRTRQTDV